jgi:hypothetical protein
MKYGNLNFLEPSRPLQVCKGTALPLLFKLKSVENITFNLMTTMFYTFELKQYVYQIKLVFNTNGCIEMHGQQNIKSVSHLRSLHSSLIMAA